jgi:hypothetical protein
MAGSNAGPTGADYFQRDAPSQGGPGGRRRYDDDDRGGYRNRDWDRDRRDRDRDRDRDREGRGGGGGRRGRLAFTEEGGEEDVPGVCSAVSFASSRTAAIRAFFCAHVGMLEWWASLHVAAWDVSSVCTIHVCVLTCVCVRMRARARACVIYLQTGCGSGTRMSG